MAADVADLVARVRRGDRVAAARLITLLDNRAPGAREAMKLLYAATGRAHVVGITGPPGSGKSTLVDKLVVHARNAGRTVGVVAIDPSSPFTGGALLGDRIRMQSRATDPEVFIRSMGSRGALGGLSRGAFDAVRVLDAMGKDVIFVETVGVGQAEVDVVRLADSVVVVAVPGLGDEVQNIKAGLMEIADVFVVNKSDREGSDKTVAELEAWLEMKPEGEWMSPVLRTVAETGNGVPELVETLARHRATLQGVASPRRRMQAEHDILEALRDEVARRAMEGDKARARFADLTDRVAKREIDPYSAADELAR